jgi:CheY-like chemotaxis protein
MDSVSARILLVDDEPALLKLITSYLTRLGYSVTGANTTEKAWTEMEASLAGDQTDFAVAVLDATMPGLPMPDLAKRMLKSSGTLRVLTSSGYPFDISELEQMAPGRVSFLHKPYSPEMLAATIRRMLAPKEENL